MSLGLLLCSCGQPPSVVKERPVATVTLATPAPPPEVIIEAEKEAPQPAREIEGPARPSPRQNPPTEEPKFVSKDPLPKEAPEGKPAPSPDPQPGSNYPKAKARKRSTSLPIYVAPQYARWAPPIRTPQVTQPKIQRRPALSPRPPVVRRPQNPRPARVSAIPQAPNYPQRTRSGGYQHNGYQPQRNNGAYQRQVAWENEHRRLKNNYMQSRADALNIKYNRGRPRFNRHSPAVAISALAPHTRRPGPVMPWDKLGQSFQRSEQARQQLRNHERSRYTPSVPQMQRPGPPMIPGRCP